VHGRSKMGRDELARAHRVTSSGGPIVSHGTGRAGVAHIDPAALWGFGQVSWTKMDPAIIRPSPARRAAVSGRRGILNQPYWSISAEASC